METTTVYRGCIAKNADDLGSSLKWGDPNIEPDIL